MTNASLAKDDDETYGIITYNGKYEVYDRTNGFEIIATFKTRRKAENFRKRLIGELNVTS